MAERSFKLKYPWAVVDRKLMQAAPGSAGEVRATALGPQMGAFGWNVIEICGATTSPPWLRHSILACRSRKATVTTIAAIRSKAKWTSFAENNAAFHNEASRDVRAIGNRRERPGKLRN